MSDLITKVLVKEGDGSFSTKQLSPKAEYVKLRNGKTLQNFIDSFPLTESDVVNEININAPIDKPLSAKQGYVLSQRIDQASRFCGTVATYEALPTENNRINDTYYVEQERCKFSWFNDGNGNTGWAQSSAVYGDFDLGGLGYVYVSPEEPLDYDLEARMWIDSDSTSQVTIPTIEDLAELVVYSPSEPSNENTRIWIDSSEEEEYEIPTMVEFNELRRRVAALEEKYLTEESILNKYY